MEMEGEDKHVMPECYAVKKINNTNFPEVVNRTSVFFYFKM